MKKVTDDYRRTIAILKKVGPVKITPQELSDIEGFYLSMELGGDGFITLSAGKYASISQLI